MKRELLEIQVARVIALIAVLSVHFTSIGVTNTPTDSVMFYVYSILNSFGRVGVPAFFFFSGLVLYYSYFHKEFTFKMLIDFYWKRIKYIVIPYISFCLFYFITTWVIYYDYSLSEGIGLFWDGLILGGTHMHLYYLYVLIQFYFLFPLLLFFFKKVSSNLLKVSTMAIILHLLWFYANKEYVLLPNRSFFFMSYFSFFVIGGLVGIHYQNMFSRYKLFTIKTIPYIFGFIFSFLVVIYYDFLTRSAFSLEDISFVLLKFFALPLSFDIAWIMLGLFGSFFFVIVAKVYLTLEWHKLDKLLLNIAKYSFGIYLIHPFFLMLCISFLSTGTPIVFHTWQLVTAILVTVLSIVFTVFVSKIKYSEFFIGK